MIVHPQGNSVMNPMLLDGSKKRVEELRASVDHFPLVGIGHWNPPTVVQRLEAFEGGPGKIVHDNEHRARRPGIGDVARADTFENLGRTGGGDDLSAYSTPRLLIVMELGAEQGLAHDADDDLLPVAVHLAEPAPVAHRAEHPDPQRIEEMLRLAIGTHPVSAVSFALLWSALVLRVVAAG